MKKHLLKYLILSVQLVFLLVPAAYIFLFPPQLGKIQISPLSGGFYPMKKPVLLADTWFSGKFSSQMNDYSKEQYPGRSWFIRLYNQFDYSVFHHSSNERIIVGEKGELYDKTYIDAWAGKDVISIDSAEQLVRNVANLRDYLHPFGTQILVITPPGKPTAMPQYLPKNFQKINAKSTNRQQFSRLLAQYKIPRLDYSEFADIQQKSPFPLFPRTGLHWSHWGAAIAADSMCAKLVSLTDKYIPTLTYSPEKYYQRNQTDWEVERAMNLLLAIPDNEGIRPIYQYQATNRTKTKPKVIVIGDSYYKIWYDQGLHQNLFHPESQFWYYGFELLPRRQINGERASVMSLDIKKELQQADLVIFLNAEINLPRLGFEVWNKFVF